jgi:hypothetical protein
MGSIKTIEDVINLEVPLARDNTLSKVYGADVSFLDGSVYPITHTVKDLRSAMYLKRDRDLGLDYIVYVDITWGNSGRAHGILAKIESSNTGRNLTTLLIIPEGYRNFRLDLEGIGSTVVEADVAKYISDDDVNKIVLEALIRQIRSWPSLKIVPVGYDEDIGIGYSKLGEEILRQNPEVTHIFVPCGGGEIGLGIYSSIKKLGGNRPQVVFVELNDKTEIEGKNLTDNKTRTKYTAYGTIIRWLENQGGIQVKQVSEEECNSEHQFLQHLGIRAEKAAALAFAGARKYDLSRSHNVVIVNSGQGKTYQRIM